MPPPPDALPTVTIYTDGGCSPNPGPGGWAAILLRPNRPSQELSGGNPATTNNQMELQAAIEALSALEQPHHITLYTDSTYLQQGITQWLPNWQRNHWQRGKQALKNRDQWQTLAQLIEPHTINWQWTKGHAGNHWNERADQLAGAQIPRPNLPLDDETAIHIFTAAAYSGKSKRGGWGVVLRYRQHQKTLSGRQQNVSANQMHLQAAISGLQSVKKTLPIHLYTASDYLHDGATRWVIGWQARNWQTKQGKPVSHRELWQTLLNLTQQQPVQWHVVSGKTPPPELEQAKRLASSA